MAIRPHTLLLLDGASHAVLVVDGPGGEVLAEIALPSGFSPIDLVLNAPSGKAYITLAGNNGAGAICILDVASRTIARLACDVPHPAHFAPSPNGNRLFLADPGGALYALDSTTLKLAAWGSSTGSSGCIGLCADDSAVYSAWETAAGGVLAIFDPAGRLLDEFAFEGKPTSIILDKLGRVFVPFTTGPKSGEGVLVFDWQQKDGSPAVITTKCSRCSTVQPDYPCHVTISADGGTAYIINEDSAAIVIADLDTFLITGSITVGKSVSRLALLDGKFGVASSNMFADLCLIDLVNRQPVSFTASSRELLSPLAVVYQHDAANDEQCPDSLSPG